MGIPRPPGTGLVVVDRLRHRPALYDAVVVPTARIMAAALGRLEKAGNTPVTGADIIGGLTPCNSIVDEILTAHPDRLRDMWIDSSNPAHSPPDSTQFRRAMRDLELSVVVDVALTETAQHADYVLPAATQCSRLGTSVPSTIKTALRANRALRSSAKAGPRSSTTPAAADFETPNTAAS